MNTTTNPEKPSARPFHLYDEEGEVIGSFHTYAAASAERTEYCNAKRLPTYDAPIFNSADENDHRE